MKHTADMAVINRVGAWRGKPIAVVQLDGGIHHMRWSSLDSSFSPGGTNYNWIRAIVDANKYPIINLPVRTSSDGQSPANAVAWDSFAQIADASPTGNVALYDAIAAVADKIASALNGKPGGMRFGWEPTNGYEWDYKWSSSYVSASDTSSLNDVKDAWSNLARIFRARIDTADVKIKTIWNQQKDWKHRINNLGQVWPDNVAVDVGTIDYYDGFDKILAQSNGAAPGDANYDYTTASYESFAAKMDAVYKFVTHANQGSKLFGVDEWGLRDTSAVGGCDNLLFVRAMMTYLKARAAHVFHDSYYSIARRVTATSVDAGDVVHALVYDDGTKIVQASPWSGPSHYVRADHTGAYVGSGSANASHYAATEYKAQF